MKMIIKKSIFIKNHSKRDIQSQITLLFFPRSLRSRLLGVISAFININIDWGISKTRKSNKQTHQIQRLQEWLYMCTQHTVILSSLCKWNCQQLLFCYYTVRSTRGQNMAVRSTQGRNRASQITQGGVTLMVMDCGTCIIFIRFRIPDPVYVTKVRKKTFCLKHFFCKHKCPLPFYTDLGLPCTLLSCEC